MAQIDGLEIQIAVSAEKANKAIRHLTRSLGALSTALKIDTSGLDKIGKSLNFSGVDKATKNIQSQTQKVSKSLSQITEQYKDLGKGFEIKGSTQQIQKQIDNLTNKLANAKLKKEEFEKSGKTNLGGYETAVKNVIKYTNQIESLKNQLAGLQTAQPKLDFGVTGTENATKYLIEYKKQLMDFKNDMKSIGDVDGGLQNVPKGFLDTPIQNLKQFIEELKQSYPQATNVIFAFEKELQKLQGISAGLTREPVKVNVDTSSIDRVNEKIAELKNRFEKVGADFKFTGNFEQLNIEIEKVYSKLNELRTKEQEMISAGKVNTPEFEQLQESLARVGNKFGIMQDLRDRTEEFNQSLQNLKVPPIKEENLTKLQNSLRKTEADTEKLRTKLSNAITMGRIVPNIDDSGFRKLTEQIALSEKQAEALRQKMQEVGGDTRGTGSIMDRLKSSLSNFSRQSNKTSSATNILSKNIKNLSSTMSGFSKSAGKAVTGLKSFTKQALSAMGIYLGVYGAVRGLKSSIESSMNYIEILNYFNAAFGQVAEKADYSKFEEMGYNSAESYYNSFSERAKELTQKMTGFTMKENGMLESVGMKSLGINPAQLMNYQAMFAQMSSSMGITSENAIRLSTVLTEIGADLASVKNMKFDKVWNDMASGLAGMSRTLDKYGANIRNVNLQQKLNELGINANISALNQNDKALLRTIILLDSTRYAWGDLAKTINQPANQLRLLQSNFSNLGRAIGNIFLPIVAKVLPYINMLVQALTRLAEWLVKLLGFEGFDWGGGGGGNSTPDILGDIYDNADDVSGALDNVASSAKKAKAGLRGFDELKTINMPESEEPDGGSGGAGAGGIGGGALQGALDSILDEYQAAWDKAFSEMENRANTFADNVAKAFKEKGLYGVGEYFSKSITKALENIPWESVYEGARNFGKGLADFLNGLISPDLFGALGKTIAGALNTVVYSALSFGLTFDFVNLGESIAEGVNQFFATFDFAALAQTLNVWAKGILDTAITSIENTDWEMIGEQIGEFLATLDIMEILGKLGTLVRKVANAFTDAWVGAFKKAPLETLLISLWAIPKVLKAIISSKFVTGIAKIASNFVKFGKNTILVTSALAGNRTALAALSTNYPRFGKAVDVARQAFSNFRFGIENGNFMTGLNAGITTIRNNLTGLQKGAITAVAGFAEFNIVSDAFEGLTLGTENLVSGLGKIGIAVAAAGAAMYVALGPAGLAIAAITGVVAAVKGINDAFDTIRAQEIGESIKNAMSNPGGVPLSEVTAQFSDAIGEIGESFTVITEKAAGLEQADSHIRNTWMEIEKIETAMETGVMSVEEGTSKLTQLFGELSTTASEKFTALENTLLVAFGENGVLNEVFERLGISTDNTTSTIIQLNDKVEQRIEELTKLLAETDPTNPQYATYKEELAGLMAQTDELTQAISNYDAALENIDLGDLFDEKTGEIQIEKLEGFLSELSAATETANTDIENAVKSVRTSLEQEKSLAESLGDWAAVEEIQEKLDALPNAMGVLKEDVSLKAAELTDTVQTKLIGGLDKVIEDAKTEWEEKGSFGQWINGVFGGADTEAAYVQEAVNKQVENIDKVSAAINEQLGNLETDGVVWASDAVREIYKALFNFGDNEAVDRGLSGLAALTLNEEYKKMINGATEGISEISRETGREFGDNTVEGYGESIENNTAGEDAAKSWMDRIYDAVHDGIWNFGSPSKTAEEFGKYTVEGYNNGIESNTESTISTVERYTTSIFDKFSEIIMPMNQIGIDAMQGLLNGLSSMESSIYAKADEIANNVANSVKTALDIHSPSKVMFALGDYTMQGFQKGMENLYQPILASVKDFSYDVAVAPAPNLTDMYGDYQYQYTYTPQHRITEYPQSGYNQNNAETNNLLRRQNELLERILAKPNLSNQDVFDAAQTIYKGKATRIYGNSSYFDPVWG